MQNQKSNQGVASGGHLRRWAYRLGLGHNPSPFAALKPFSDKEKATATALMDVVKASLPLEQYRDDPHVARALEALEAATTSLAFVHYRDLSGAVRQALFRSDT